MQIENNSSWTSFSLLFSLFSLLFSLFPSFSFFFFSFFSLLLSFSLLFSLFLCSLYFSLVFSHFLSLFSLGFLLSERTSGVSPVIFAFTIVPDHTNLSRCPDCKSRLRVADSQLFISPATTGCTNHHFCLQGLWDDLVILKSRMDFELRL